MANKRVLIITYYWPPSGGAGVQRWLKFAKYMPEFGWDPIIYTPENPEAPALDESLLNEVPSNIEVIKRKIWEPYQLYKRFTRKPKGTKVNAGFLKESDSSSFLEKISVFIRGNLFIPDARKFWIKPSIKHLSSFLDKNPVDAMISTGPPHSMHLIGLGLKKKLNIPWVADFRDPWTDIDFYDQLLLTKNADIKHHRLERTVLEMADKVVTIGNQASHGLTKKFAREIDIITNGFDSDDIPEQKPDLDSKFSIVHVGAMNKDRNHSAFWDSIQELVNESMEFAENLLIKLIGKIDISVIESLKERDLLKYTTFIPYLDHQDAIFEMMKARLLYLPINNTPNAKSILTGKIFEYLATSRQILAVGPTNGDVAEILKSTESGQIFDFDNKSGIRKFLKDAYGKETKRDSYKIDIFSRKNLTYQYVKILNSIS